MGETRGMLIRKFPIGAGSMPEIPASSAGQPREPGSTGGLSHVPDWD
jgi:hypothetical protein